MQACMGIRDSRTVAMAVIHLLDLEVGDFHMDMVEVVVEDSHTALKAVGTMAPLEGEDSHQEDTVAAFPVDMGLVVVDSHSEDQEDQVVEVQPQEEVSRVDPAEADLVVEDSHSVGLVVVVAEAMVHRPQQEGHTPYLHPVWMMTPSTANQTSRHTQTTSRSKTGPTGSAVYATYCMLKGWNRC